MSFGGYTREGVDIPKGQKKGDGSLVRVCGVTSIAKVLNAGCSSGEETLILLGCLVGKYSRA